jgi:hypothetical protein
MKGPTATGSYSLVPGQQKEEKKAQSKAASSKPKVDA